MLQLINVFKSVKRLAEKKLDCVFCAIECGTYMFCGTWHYPNKNLLEAEQEHWIFLLDIGDLVHVSIIF